MSTKRPNSVNDDDAKAQAQPIAKRRFKITYELPDGSLESVVESYTSRDEAIFQAEQRRLWHSTIVSVEEA